VRYIGRHGAERVSKAVLIGAVPPLMLKTEKNPGGLPLSAFDGIRAGVTADRSQFFKDLTTPFYGYNKPDAKISQGVRDAFWQVLNLADNFKAVITTPAWRSKPSWMVVPTKDRTINPDLERWYATRANSHKVEVSGASHSVYVSRPTEVAAVIEEAASHATSPIK
jgi:pimeloyl-ACP methyl ester carboxylesterase